MAVNNGMGLSNKLARFNAVIDNPEDIGTAPVGVPVEPPSNPRAHWITPQQQLSKLGYLVDSPLTHWHKAHKMLGTLPEKLPPLPENIAEIMGSPCSIYPGKKIEETHVLALIPEESGSLNQFASKISKIYRENTLQFEYSRDEIREKYADTPFSPTHWVLMTKDVLPKSKGMAFEDQLTQLSPLVRKSGMRYQVPTLQQSLVAIMTHRIATREILYPVVGTRYGPNWTLTYVKETLKDSYTGLVVGAFSASGVQIGSNFTPYGNENIGLAFLQEL